jgi:glycosyltransferase involved in cell wall biosynthesis
MRVLMPGRILERHVGGNTTYARAIAEGVRAKGVVVESMQYGSHPMSTLLAESRQARQKPVVGDVLHYVADTGPLVRTRTPSLVTVHGVASHWIDGVRTRHQELLWRRRVGRAITCTDRVVTVSRSSARDIADVFDVDPGRIDVIPHGVEARRFAEPATMSVTVRDAVPRQFLLYVGNIEPRKNLPALVAAMDTPRVRELGLPLVVAGKPAWNHDEAMQAITASRNVRYLGFVSDDDRTALMQACTAFVFPSRYEGFGFPVLEAMAAGAPVVTSHAGALREVAGPSRILDGLDPDPIADGIVAAVTDERWRRDVRSAGRDWASGFLWERSIDAHLNIYEALEQS